MEKPRQIRVFISSTFRDMQAERDYLVNIVFPRIKEYCRKRYIDFVPIDLRWGITEEESRNGWVLNTCFNEIDNSRPFFIGLVGDRYGWTPSDDDLITFLLQHENESAWVDEMAARGASITEMEIEYGALRDNNVSHAIFFLRNSDDSRSPESDTETARKLERLKHKITSQQHYPVFMYSQPEEIGTIIENALVQMIEEEFPPEQNDHASALTARHENSLRVKTEDIHGINLSDFDTWIADEKKHPHDVLMIRGNAGDGVSTLVAAGVKYLRSKFSSPMLYFDFECVDGSRPPMDALREFMELPGNTPSPDKWMLLALDNTQMLSPDDCRQLVDWIRRSPQSLHIIVGATVGTPVYDFMMLAFAAPTITIHGTTPKMRREYAEHRLAKYGKKFTDAQLDKIFTNKTFKSFIEEKLFIDTMVRFGSFEELDKRIDELIKSTSLFYSILIEGSKIFAPIGAGVTYIKSVLAIAACYHGISEEDLLTVTGLEQAQWSLVRPFVIQFCSGDYGRMRLIKDSWRQDIKNTFDTTWMGNEGVAMMERIIEKMSPDRGAVLLMDIHNYLGRLPSDNYQHSIDIAISVLTSPDWAFALPEYMFFDNFYSLQFLISKANSFPIGTPLESAPLPTQILYWTRRVKAAATANRGVDESKAWQKLSELYIKSSEPLQAKYCQAKAMMAVGAPAEARPILEEIMAAADPHSDIYLDCYFAISDSFDMEGDIESMINFIDDFPELSDEDRDSHRSQLYEYLTYLAYLMTIYGADEDAQSLLRDHSYMHEELFLNDRATYTYFLTKALIFEHANMLPEMAQQANYAALAAFYIWGGKSWQYGRAILLRAYAYYKTDGSYHESNQVYKNAYNPRPFDRIFEKDPNFDWTKVDVKVRERILNEHYIYIRYLFEMQCDQARDALIAKGDTFRTLLRL